MRNNAKEGSGKYGEESGTHALYIAQSPTPAHGNNKIETEDKDKKKITKYRKNQSSREI